MHERMPRSISWIGFLCTGPVILIAGCATPRKPVSLTAPATEVREVSASDALAPRWNGQIDERALRLILPLFPETGILEPRDGVIFREVSILGEADLRERHILVVYVFRVIENMLAPRGMHDVYFVTADGEPVFHVVGFTHKPELVILPDRRFRFDSLWPLDLEEEAPLFRVPGISSVALAWQQDCADAAREAVEELLTVYRDQGLDEFVKALTPNLHGPRRERLPDKIDRFEFLEVTDAEVSPHRYEDYWECTIRFLIESPTEQRSQRLEFSVTGADSPGVGISSIKLWSAAHSPSGATSRGT